MTATRQDAWSPDEDLILAEVTLRHIREGGTQLAAFEEVGEKIGRSAAACGFRWNSSIRKQYEAAIQIAKAQRQKRNHIKSPVSPAIPAVADTEFDTEETYKPETPIEENISFDAIIRFLRQHKGNYQELVKQVKVLEKEMQEKNEELKKWRRESEELRKRVDTVQTDYRSINDDYRALIQIMDRARKMAFLADEEEDSKQKFKMDANGNLERIE
jgi:prespore-specific regulator